MHRFPGCAAFLLLLLFPLSLPAQESSPFPSSSDRKHFSFSISGTVRDATNSQGIAGARVDLHTMNGAIIATVNAGGDGNFRFDHISPGEYSLEAQILGYGDATERVEVRYGPDFGADLYLHPLHGSRPGESTVSVRELSIPQKARDAMEKGLQLLHQKMQYEKSLAEFQRAIQAYPGYYEAYTQMGIAYMILQKPDQSEQALQTAITLSKGKYVGAFYLLAMLDSNRNRFAEAEPLARKGTELDPQSWQSQFELARALYGLSRFAEAESRANAAAKLEPQDGAIRLQLAKIHYKLHNAPALLDDLNAYLRIEPNSAQAGQVREARDRIQQALATPGAAAPSGPPAGKP
jgi:tetratricopeptide (TPR) repeat protein